MQISRKFCKLAEIWSRIHYVIVQPACGSQQNFAKNRAGRPDLLQSSAKLQTIQPASLWFTAEFCKKSGLPARFFAKFCCSPRFCCACRRKPKPILFFCRLSLFFCHLSLFFCRFLFPFSTTLFLLSPFLIFCCLSLFLVAFFFLLAPPNFLSPFLIVFCRLLFSFSIPLLFCRLLISFRPPLFCLDPLVVFFAFWPHRGPKRKLKALKKNSDDLFSFFAFYFFIAGRLPGPTI